MIVKLRRRSTKYSDLSVGSLYLVLGIEADSLRLINDHGRPFLYPPELFTIVDRKKPREWVSETGPDGEHYAYPREMNEPGFFEDYFDGKAQAMATFWRSVNHTLARAI